MFLLGILVGRGTVPLPHDPNTLQDNLAELKDADIKAKMSRVKINTDAEKTQKELGFYEALKESKSQAEVKKKKQKPADKKVKRSAKKTKAPPKQKPTIQTQTSTTAKKTNTTASTRSPSSGDKNLAIQVGSFRNTNDAEKLGRLLNEKGYPAFKTMGAVPEKGIWYRVRIGYYASRDEAWKTMKRLKKEGYAGFLVTR